MNINRAKKLKYGDILLHKFNKNADGTPQRWKVNGKVKTWKRNPNKIYIPVKNGLRNYDFITEDYLGLVYEQK